MVRELEGFIIDEGADALTLTKRPVVRLRRAAPAALFLLLCAGGAIASALGLITGEEWTDMSLPQQALSVGVVIVLSTMSVGFGRSLYAALDRGFRVRAHAQGVSLRRHHFSRFELPRELITAVHVRARTFQPPRQPRYCQVRLELELEGIEDTLDLLGLGMGKTKARDEPDARTRLTAAGLELGGLLAKVLGVPVVHTDFAKPL